MGHKNLAGAVADLERHGHLKRIDVELDPNLEIPALHRRVSAAGGPALLFTRPKGCRFSLASNLFGTIERIRFLFRDTLDSVHRLMELQADPERLARTFWRYLDIPWRGLSSLPRVAWHSPVLANSCPLEHLPKVKCWPDDGGAFVTLPLVYSEDPAKRGWRHSNLGMYRVQLDGNEYLPNQEVGIHYQIHRDCGRTTGVDHFGGNASSGGDTRDSLCRGPGGKASAPIPFSRGKPFPLPGLVRRGFRYLWPNSWQSGEARGPFWGPSGVLQPYT